MISKNTEVPELFGRNKALSFLELVLIVQGKRILFYYIYLFEIQSEIFPNL